MTAGSHSPRPCRCVPSASPAAGRPSRRGSRSAHRTGRQRLAGAAPDRLRIADPLRIGRAGRLARVEFGAAQVDALVVGIPRGAERRPVFATRGGGEPQFAERRPTACPRYFARKACARAFGSRSMSRLSSANSIQPASGCAASASRCAAVMRAAFGGARARRARLRRRGSLRVARGGAHRCAAGAGARCWAAPARNRKQATTKSRSMESGGAATCPDYSRAACDVVFTRQRSARSGTSISAASARWSE
jgi:hypothetical protein